MRYFWQILRNVNNLQHICEFKLLGSLYFGQQNAYLDTISHDPYKITPLKGICACKMNLFNPLFWTVVLDHIH